MSRDRRHHALRGGRAPLSNVAGPGSACDAWHRKMSPIVDTHVHILSFPSFENLEDKIRTTRDIIEFRDRYPDLFRAGRSEEAIDNSSHLLERMDRYGVTHAVVQPTSGNTTNEQVADVVRQHPDRF